MTGASAARRHGNGRVLQRPRGERPWAEGPQPRKPVWGWGPAGPAGGIPSPRRHGAGGQSERARDGPVRPPGRWPPWPRADLPRARLRPGPGPGKALCPPVPGPETPPGSDTAHGGCWDGGARGGCRRRPAACTHRPCWASTASDQALLPAPMNPVFWLGLNQRGNVVRWGVQGLPQDPAVSLVLAPDLTPLRPHEA